MLTPEKRGHAMTLGQQIAAARKEKGMTQEMLAEQLGVTRQAVARWETGKALPSTANLFMLREVLNITLDTAKTEEKLKTAEQKMLIKAEKAESLTAKQKRIMLAVVTILLWFALQFAGLGVAIGLLFLLLVSIIVLFFIMTVKNGIAAAAKAAAENILYLAGTTLLAVILWSIAFTVSANYKSEAVWKVPQNKWKNYPAIAEWVQHCKARENGIYMQKVELPAKQGYTTAYLVYRNGVTDAAAGKITSHPLRLRFWVTYRAGESEPMLDVLTFHGNKEYQVFFRIGKDRSDCTFTTYETEELAGETSELLSELNKKD